MLCGACTNSALLRFGASDWHYRGFRNESVLAYSYVEGTKVNLTNRACSILLVAVIFSCLTCRNNSGSDVGLRGTHAFERCETDSRVNCLYDGRGIPLPQSVR
ncbi:hypothetical protein Y032_0069g321 [Ancylostoma ceylanicum]|uniref:Uncharacterized protein n=1 Tax=Ancylostoma ceylanicum TaxID=53326 RepID=A0A016TZ55_9BILA|nr:hypothetical protein Y032_0069g321 [Ancylostoma ceylanicum]